MRLWLWPKIDDLDSAQGAARGGTGASAIVAAVTGIAAILSIIYRKPILGLDGWSLVDAGLFVFIAWRISKMSRTWAIIGLGLYLLEVGERLVNAPGKAIGVITIVFILAFISAIRGTFAFHRYRKQETYPQSPRPTTPEPNIRPPQQPL